MAVIKNPAIGLSEGLKPYIEAPKGAHAAGDRVEIDHPGRTTTYPADPKKLNRLNRHLAGQTVAHPAWIEVYTVTGAGVPFQKGSEIVQRFYLRKEGR